MQEDLFDTIEDSIAPPIAQQKKAHKIVEKCHVCGKVAKEKSSIDFKGKRIVTLECFHQVVREIPKGTPFEDFITFEHRDNGCKHKWVKNQCGDCGAYRLYPFQVEGARFIEQGLAAGKGVGLFDDPGLGKTIQPLAVLNYHPELFPVLFVVKSKLKFQFFKALIRWLGPEYFAQIIRSGKDPVIPGLKCYITSFDTLEKIDFSKAGIKLCIVDECQHVKSERAKRTKALQDFVFDTGIQVVPMSGTPWKNRGSEYFVALNMISPQKFPTKQGFLDAWVDYQPYGESYKERGIRDIPRFREYTKDIVIRREMSDVLPELPETNRTLHYCELDTIEQKTYDGEVSNFVDWYNDKVIGGDENSFEVAQHILAKLNIMRHITGLAKVPATIDLVTDHIKETQRSIVIFIHHIDVGDIFYQELKALDIAPVHRLLGGTSDDETYNVVQKFNSSSPAIAIASTLAAGEGLDELQHTCSDCILHERQWNPANEEQAERRLRRIGQEASFVNAVYVTAAETVDEYLSGIVERKRVDFHAVMNNSEMPAWNQEGIMEELAKAIVAGHKSKLKQMASF